MATNVQTNTYVGGNNNTASNLTLARLLVSKPSLLLNATAMLTNPPTPPCICVGFLLVLRVPSTVQWQNELDAQFPHVYVYTHVYVWHAVDCDVMECFLPSAHRRLG